MRNKKRKKKNKKQFQDQSRGAALHSMQRKGYVIEDGKIEHRAVYTKTYGRIPKGWVVHHINEIKDDNRPENLIALPQHIHDQLHKIQRDRMVHFDRERLVALVEKMAPVIEEIDDAIEELQARIRGLLSDRNRVGYEELEIAAQSAPTYASIRLYYPVKEVREFTPKVLLRKKDA